MNYTDKYTILWKFIANKNVSTTAALVASWLMCNKHMLEKCKFVDDVTLAPDYLILGNGQDKFFPVFLSINNDTWKSISDCLESDEEISMNDILLDVTASITTAKKSLSTVIAELKAFDKTDKELYVTIYPPITGYELDDNKYKHRVDEYQERMKTKQQDDISNVINASIELAILHDKLDKALSERDFDQCKSISDRIKEIENSEQT